MFLFIRRKLFWQLTDLGQSIWNVAVVASNHGLGALRRSLFIRCGGNLIKFVVCVDKAKGSPRRSAAVFVCLDEAEGEREQDNDATDGQAENVCLWGDTALQEGDFLGDGIKEKSHDAIVMV